MDQTKGITAFWASIVCANIWGATNISPVSVVLSQIWIALAVVVLFAMKGK